MMPVPIVGASTGTSMNTAITWDIALAIAAAVEAVPDDRRRDDSRTGRADAPDESTEQQQLEGGGERRPDRADEIDRAAEVQHRLATESVGQAVRRRVGRRPGR